MFDLVIFEDSGMARTHDSREPAVVHRLKLRFVVQHPNNTTQESYMELGDIPMAEMAVASGSVPKLMEVADVWAKKKGYRELAWKPVNGRMTARLDAAPKQITRDADMGALRRDAKWEAEERRINTPA